MQILSTFKFCLQMLLRASKKYFLLLISITIVSSITPFAVLFFVSRLIQFLSDNINNIDIQYHQLLLILFWIITINIINKAIEYARTYISGLLNELVDKESELLLMNKASYLDLSYFDSNVFYNELKDATLNKQYLINTTFSIVELIKSLLQLMIAVIYLSQISIIGSIALSIAIIPNVIFLRKQYISIYSLQKDNLDISRKKYYMSYLTQDKNYAKEIKIYNGRVEN